MSEALEPTHLERRTAPIELLWDLVFVFAITRVTTLLGADLTWAGFGRAMLALALVWWAWSAFAWATNAQEPDSPALRLALLAATVLIFIAGLALPRAFGSEGTLFAATYACVRFVHLALYVHASRQGKASLGAIAGFAVTVAIGMGLLIGGSFASGGARVALWASAAAIDYAGPAWLTRERLRGLQRVAVAHFAERYGLFVLICLGESIVAIGIGAGTQPLGSREVSAVAFSLLITISFWWVYFDRFAALAEARLRTHSDPVIAAADGYSYLHLLIVAGIIVFAVGAKAALAHVGAPLADGARLALYGGASLYLIGHAAFRARMTGSVHVVQILVALAALVLYPVSGQIAAWGAIGTLALALSVLVAWEILAGRRLALQAPPAAQPSGEQLRERERIWPLSRPKTKEI
jgi:low temperature requirement protein LtrA